MPTINCWKPSGNGGFSGFPSTSCLSGTGISASRPRNARSGSTSAALLFRRKRISSSVPRAPTSAQERDESRGECGEHGSARDDRAVAVCIRAAAVRRRDLDAVRSCEPAHGRGRRRREVLRQRQRVEHLPVGGYGLATLRDAVAVRHHDQQWALVDEEELLPEELGVLLRLAPESGDRAEIIRYRDHRDLDREALLLR